MWICVAKGHALWPSQYLSYSRAKPFDPYQTIKEYVITFGSGHNITGLLGGENRSNGDKKVDAVGNMEVLYGRRSNKHTDSWILNLNSFCTTQTMMIHTTVQSSPTSMSAPGHHNVGTERQTNEQTAAYQCACSFILVQSVNDKVCSCWNKLWSL